MLKIAARKVAQVAERENVSQAIKSIIRCSLTEFEKGMEQYKVFRTTNDTPDWGVVRLSSIAMSQNRKNEAENILKEQYDETGGVKRQARHVDVSDEQVCAAIERVLRKDLKAGFEFYELLLRNKYCTNRDVFLSIMIKEVVEKSGWKSGIEKLEEMLKTSENRKKTKSLKMSVYYILKAAKNENQYEEAEAEIISRSFVKPSVIRGISILTKLDGDSMLNVADYLKRSNISFTNEDIRFITEMAGRIKSHLILQNLLDIDRFVKIPLKSHYLVYDEMIKIAGKIENLNILEQITSRVKSSKNLDQEQKFTLYSKIRHFYKCLNVKTPKELYILLDNASQ